MTPLPQAQADLPAQAARRNAAKSVRPWPKAVTRAAKVVLHLALLGPALYLAQRYRTGGLALDPDPVNTITHFTGDWALWILLGSLAITPIRRLSPRLAPLVRFRRLIGLYAFFYATLHFATYVFLFSGFDLPGAFHAGAAGRLGDLVAQWRQVWPTILDDLRKRHFIQAGLFSWAILLALAITSPSAVMRWIGGRGWQRLHRLVYVAGVCAVVHFWWLVKAGNRAPWKVTVALMILLLARLFVAWWKRLARRR